jgi:PAS domain S-box-containing protein
LRFKLTAIVMSTTCVTLLLALVGLAVFDHFNFREQICRQLETRAGIVASSSTRAVSFGDKQLARQILAAFRTESTLGTLALYDADGRFFASYVRPGWNVAIPDSLRHRGTFVATDHIQVSSPVTVENRTIGYVMLQSDLSRFEQRSDHFVPVGLFVMVAAATVGFLLASWLQLIISKPIRELSATSRQIAEERDYSLRATRHGNDELGQLVDGFNGMVAEIQSRDAVLRGVQGELEARIGERTRELFISNARLKEEVEANVRSAEESNALRRKLQAAYEHLQMEAEQRSEVQEALRRSEERFSKAFRANPVPLAILTRNSCVFVDVNDRFAEFAGMRREAIIAQPMFSVPVWGHPETRARIEQWLADGHALRNWECKVQGASGETRAALLSTESFQLGSEPCLLLMTEDISERASLEGQLRQAQKMEAIGQLASGVAHDFNNLLTIIQGYTQLVIAMQPQTGMAREALEKVTNATQRAAQLTGQLLTFSRKQIAKPRSLDLNSVVTNVTGMLRPLLGENVKLKTQLASALPNLEGDSGMLEQVIVNLAVNARDAMPRGGDLILNSFTCEIDASYRHYQPLAQSGTFVCLQVSDTGCGMDAKTLERIFEPFFTTKGVGKGTGLGLATVYGIIKQHRGWIEVASQVGVGTTFKIFLPAAQVSAAGAENASKSAEVKGGNELIMVVEDEPALRELFISILHGFGYRTIEAAHGREAIELWDRSTTKPAMLLTDMMMPEGVTGWELAETLRGHAPELKVVYTSGYSPELFGNNVKLNERSNFLPKPFNPRTLAQTVRQCLDN